MKQFSHAPSLPDAPFETIYVVQSRVACDGGGGALGHPRVYLTIDSERQEVVCSYCSRTYRLKEGHH